MGSRKWVFAVHEWETGDGKHHVTFGTDKRNKTKGFGKWSNAEKFAKKQALKMKLKAYMIDTPKRPHHLVLIKPKKPTTKPRKHKKRVGDLLEGSFLW